jgi:hypothetical protein
VRHIPDEFASCVGGVLLQPFGVVVTLDNPAPEVLAHFLDDCGLKGFHHPSPSAPFLTSHVSRHGTARHGTARHGTARHDTTRHDTTRHDARRTTHDTRYFAGELPLHLNGTVDAGYSVAHHSFFLGFDITLPCHD